MTPVMLHTSSYHRIHRKGMENIMGVEKERYCEERIQCATTLCACVLMGIIWIDETWWNNPLLLVTNCYVVVAMVATSCPCGCVIEMSHTEINKDASHWPLTFNLWILVTWPWTCAFHAYCTHTLEIIDMHRGVCDKRINMIKYLQDNYWSSVPMPCKAWYS